MGAGWKGLTALVLLVALATYVFWRGGSGESAGNYSRCPDCNVLLIVVDAVRADHVGAYGYGRNTTPNIDAFAREGVLFENAVTQWPKTSPAMAALLTGTYGHTNGVMRKCKLKVPLENVLLAEVLGGEGFRTLGVVANANLDSFYSFNQGMDRYLFTGRVLKGNHDDAGSVYLLASRFLKNASGGRFFLLVHFVDPHHPYAPPTTFNESFVGDGFYGRRGLVFDMQEPCTHSDMFMPCKNRMIAGSTNLDYYVAQYDGEIRYSDYYVGRLLERLGALGLRNKTLVIITSDHGESLGEHNYYFGHGRLPYDECARVPLAVSFPPAIPPGKRVKTPVALIDVMPTVLDFLDIKNPEIIEGESLLPTVFSNDTDKKR